MRTDYRKTVLNRVLDRLLHDEELKIATSKYDMKKVYKYWAKWEYDKFRQTIQDGYVEELIGDNKVEWYRLTPKGKRTAIAREKIRTLWLKIVYPNKEINLLTRWQKWLDKGNCL